jgi:hypothetical protein
MSGRSRRANGAAIPGSAGRPARPADALTADAFTAPPHGDHPPVPAGPGAAQGRLDIRRRPRQNQGRRRALDPHPPRHSQIAGNPDPPDPPTGPEQGKHDAAAAGQAGQRPGPAGQGGSASGAGGAANPAPHPGHRVQRALYERATSREPGQVPAQASTAAGGTPQALTIARVMWRGAEALHPDSAFAVTPLPAPRPAAQRGFPRMSADQLLRVDIERRSALVVA